MKTLLSCLDKKRPVFVWWLSVLVVLVICYIFILAEKYMDISILLVIPVLLVSWYGSNKAGSILAMLSALLITVARIVAVHNNEAIYYLYSFLGTLGTLLLVAIIVTNFRKVHRVESDAADTDTLTGLHSQRSFYTYVEREINRSKRYGHRFSIAYIDVDNFKYVNDTLGHDSGDKLLIELSKCLIFSLRATDVVARIGGDEFVCLFPETGATEAKEAILKAEKALKHSMQNRSWPVSFSVGVVTFEKVPKDVHKAIKIADELMYSVKNCNKDNIAYKIC